MFVPLTIEEANAMLAKFKGKATGMNNQNKRLTEVAETEKILSALEQKIAKGIEEVCGPGNPKEGAKKNLGEKNKKKWELNNIFVLVFAKLSSRSPKDATNRKARKNELISQILKGEILFDKKKSCFINLFKLLRHFFLAYSHHEKEEQKKTPDTKLSKNSIIGCIYQAHMSALKLFTEKDVLETLLASDRVMNDEIPLALEHSKRVTKK